MRVGIDAHMLGHRETGNETYVLELVRALAQRESADTFFIYVESPQMLPLSVHGAPHIRVVQLESRSAVTRLVREFPRRAKQDQLDVLHVSYNAPPRSSLPCSLVVTIHDISFEEHPEWFPRRLRALLKWSVPRSARTADAVLTDTESARQDLIRIYHLTAGKIHITPYAAHARFRPADNPALLAPIRAKYNTSSQFVLAVSNMQPRKNLSRLMQAFVQVKRHHNLPHKLVLVGQPLWSSARDLDLARSLGDSVVVTGYVPDDDLPLLYNAADVLCYPSLYEGFGLPVLEGMACGVPVITSNLSSLPEVAGDAALLVNPYSVSELADALVLTLTDPSARDTLRERGFARAGAFSWERTARQTLEVYHLAAQSLRAPPAASFPSKSGYGNDLNGLV